MIESKFKNTEIGLIPEDWEVLPFSKSFKDLRNNTFSRDMLNDDKGEIKNVHYGDVLIKYGEVLDFDKEQVPFITDSSKYTSYDALENGDIIMADTAEDETVGKVCEIMNIGNNVAVSGLHTIALRPLVKCAPRFLGYFLNSKIYHDQLLPLIQGTKVSSISKTPLKDTCLVLPPLAEQRRIAEVLSESDDLIKQWENVIAKKRDIKTGTMQLLLSGKKRLEGFDKPWVEKKLGEVGVTYNGLTGKTKNDFGDGEALYITFLNILNNPILDTTIFEKVNVSKGEKQNRALKGDLFFNTSSETPEEVGYCAVLDADVDNLYLNSFCFGYRIKDNNIYPNYLAYYFRSKQGREFMAKLAQGVTRYNISKSAFNEAILTLPSLSEQRAIAEILSDMDEEIKTLEQKVAKLRDIKSGMMQQLLSGKIRLKGEEGNNVRQFVENNFGGLTMAAEDEAEFLGSGR